MSEFAVASVDHYDWGMPVLSSIFEVLAVEVIIREFTATILILSRVVDPAANAVAPVEISVITEA